MIEECMSMQRPELRLFGGWALIANAVIGIVLLVDLVLNLSHPTALTMLQLLGILMYVVGIPTIQFSQPEAGRGGQIAIALLELSAAVAFVIIFVNLVSSSDLPSSAAVSSALLGMVGGVLLGAFTIHLHRFPSWVGWFLAISVTVNFVTGQLSDALGFKILAECGILLGILATAQYGWTIVQAYRVGEAQPRLV
jgi:hypothetical protein